MEGRRSSERESQRELTPAVIRGRLTIAIIIAIATPIAVTISGHWPGRLQPLVQVLMPGALIQHVTVGGVPRHGQGVW